MKELIRLTVVLGVICIVSAVALSQVYQATKEPIALAREAEAKDAAAQVLGPVMVEGAAMDKRAGEGPEGRDLFVASQGGQELGVAFTVVSSKGYSGDIVGMLGLDPAGNVLGYRVVMHAETPGLGANIASDEKWLHQLVFKGEERRNLTNTDWRVKKDGGEIDALTGATITPRAVAGSLQAGLEWHRDRAAASAPEAAPVEPVEPTPDPSVEEGGAVDEKLPAAEPLPEVKKTPVPITGKTLTE